MSDDSQRLDTVAGAPYSTSLPTSSSSRSRGTGETSSSSSSRGTGETSSSSSSERGTSGGRIETRVHIVGIGMGAHHVTGEAADALRDADYVIAAQKRDGDALLAIRREIADSFDLDVVAVPDPVRDREAAGDGGYVGAVAGWHAARVAAYEAVLAEREGTAAFLVWGDPAFYDSTIRIVEAIAERGNVEVAYDVVPGISALQLLAARHRLVLHDVGQPLHLTTGRKLAAAVAAGQQNVAVMLNRSLELDGLEDWSIWWGANLGRPEEALVAGRVGEVAAELEAARAQVKDAVGWVLDIFLVRQTSSSSSSS